MLTLRVLTFAAVAALAACVPADEPRPAELGQPAPDFSVTDINGKPLRLSDRLKSGEKHVVLMFSRANW